MPHTTKRNRSLLSGISGTAGRSAIGPCILLLSLGSGASAQSGEHRAYVAHLTGLTNETHVKVVSEALTGWEALEAFEVSGSAHRVKFIAMDVVEEGALSERLNGTGTAVFWLAEVQPDGSLSGLSYEQHAFPVLHDTGDPAADNAQYDLDKAAWLAAHPGWIDVNTLDLGGSQEEHVK